jgi:hypothetical protein
MVSKVVYAYVRLGKRRRMTKLRAIAERFGGRLWLYIVIT